jgi:hypothetical protein
MTAGLPAVAERILGARSRLAARALETALAADPEMRERYGEEGLRRLLRDAELLAERVASSVASGDPGTTRQYASSAAPVYRRRRVPMDDLIALCEGLRSAFPNVLAPHELGAAGEALDEAIDEFRWYRRLAGDARRRNAFLQFIYKGG